MKPHHLVRLLLLAALAVPVSAAAQTRIERRVVPLSQYKAMQRQAIPLRSLRPRPGYAAPPPIQPSPAPPIRAQDPAVTMSVTPPPPSLAPLPAVATPSPVAVSPAQPAMSVRKPIMPMASTPAGSMLQRKPLNVPAPAAIPPSPSIVPPSPTAGAVTEPTYFDSRDVQASRQTLPPALDISISNTYRRDEADWNIAADPSGTQTPNILSELTWKKIRSYQLKGEAAYTQRTGMLKGVHLEGAAYTAWTFSGDNQDSDYLGNDRTGEFSRSNNDASSGDMHGYRGAVGYAIELTDPGNARDYGRYIALTPLVGYALDNQLYAMTDGFQTIPASGPFPGLDSSYEMEWSGAFLGLGLDSYFEHNRYRFSLRGEYHSGDYEGVGRWNLRPNFRQPDSFLQEADATGVVIQGRFGYMPLENMEIFIAGGYQDWSTDNGLDRTFLSNGTFVDGRLNEANWSSTELTLGAAFRW